MTDPNLFITSMPASRPADYYLGYMDGSVFIDFNNCEEDKICLARISFDGYGCCDLGNQTVPLNKQDSRIFKEIVQDQIKDQDMLAAIVKRAISLNKEWIWLDALEEYQLT